MKNSFLSKTNLKLKVINKKKKKLNLWWMFKCYYKYIVNNNNLNIKTFRNIITYRKKSNFFFSGLSKQKIKAYNELSNKKHSLLYNKLLSKEIRERHKEESKWYSKFMSRCSKLGIDCKEYFLDHEIRKKKYAIGDEFIKEFEAAELLKEQKRLWESRFPKKSDFKISEKVSTRTHKGLPLNTNKYWNSFMLTNLNLDRKYHISKYSRDMDSLIKENRIWYSALVFFCKKHKLLLEFKFKKQFIYNILGSIFSLKEDFFTLISRETLNEYVSNLCVKKETKFISIHHKFNSFSIFNCNWIYKNKLILKKQFILNKNSYILHLFYFSIYLRSNYDNENKFIIFEGQNKHYIFDLNNTVIENQNWNDTRRVCLNATYNNLHNYLELRNISNKSTASILNIKSNFFILNEIKQNNVKNNLNILNFIWKKNFINKKKSFFFSKKRTFGWVKDNNAYSKQLSKSIFFVLSKIYTKLKQVSKNSKAFTHLLNLKNVLFFEIFNKLTKQKSKNLILTNRMFIRRLRRKKWSFFFLKQLYSSFNNLYTTNYISRRKSFILSTFLKKREVLRKARGVWVFISKNSYFKSYRLAVKKPKIMQKTIKLKVLNAKAYNMDINYPYILNNKHRWSRRRKKVRRKALWKEKKLIVSQLKPKFTQLNTFFSFLFKNSTALFFINALSLTKFAFIYPLKKRSVNKFLKEVEREMIAKFKYIAVYIQDLVRICFLSLFLKKPAFLTSFIGFQIAKLPKNRKETKLIRFIIKVVKIFSSQRVEMLGLKIEFKGRVNRWRRTKIIRGIGGEKVLLPLFSYNTLIEFGSSKSITRKGALGIRLWLCYQSLFGDLLSEVIVGYVKYSKIIKLRTVKRFLNKFKTKIR